MLKVFPETSRIESGRLHVGGRDVVELAEAFGTPVVIFDRAAFEGRARSFASALPPDKVSYAGKSFSCVAVFQLVKGLGLSLDVCTGGELATAEAAEFPPERITFHGNNKSESELEQAKAYGVGKIVIDSF